MMSFSPKTQMKLEVASQIPFALEPFGAFGAHMLRDESQDRTKTKTYEWFGRVPGHFHFDFSSYKIEKGKSYC